MSVPDVEHAICDKRRGEEGLDPDTGAHDSNQPDHDKSTRVAKRRRFLKLMHGVRPDFFPISPMASASIHTIQTRA